MSSELEVKIRSIRLIESHPNADKLEIVHIDGWQCIVRKNIYKANDLIVYIPIDSVLPEKLEKSLFGEDSKVKLTNGRVKTIRLRGVMSQGLVATPNELNITKIYKDKDVKEELGIIKYEPHVPSYQNFNPQAIDENKNEKFTKYSSISNIKNSMKLFKDDDYVVISEKIHGTNARYSWLERSPKTIWDKILNLFGKFDKYEFYIGSHNVQLNLKNTSKDNIYLRIAEQYDLKNKLYYGQTLYGEIYGPGIQKNYNYGLKPGELAFAAFDLKSFGKYVNYEFFKDEMEVINVPIVPILDLTTFEGLNVSNYFIGESGIHPSQKIKEGVVIKTVIESEGCRKIVKAINPEYLLKGDSTDFH